MKESSSQRKINEFVFENHKNGRHLEKSRWLQKQANAFYDELFTLQVVVYECRKSFRDVFIDVAARIIKKRGGIVAVNGKTMEQGQTSKKSLLHWINVRFRHYHIVLTIQKVSDNLSYNHTIVLRRFSVHLQCTCV